MPENEEKYLKVNNKVSVPFSELIFKASKSGGPGGQHQNKTSSAVELLWDIENSSIDDSLKSRIKEKLQNRIDTEGILHLRADQSRSQFQNKKSVTERFRQFLAQALFVPKPRKKTKPSKAAKEKRLKEKKKRSEIKDMRKWNKRRGK